MTVVSALSPLSLNTIFDIQGLPVRPARLFFLAAQTQSPLVVWQDANLSIPHQQPVVTTGNGRVPPIFVGPDAYRVRIFDSFGQLIEDIDNIPGAVQPTSGGGGGGGTINPGDPRLVATGDILWSFSNALRTGFVRCNGYTIGSVTSGASERANADTQALFEWLWNQDTSHLLPIPGGRGSSSIGDWNANKQITLPDLRARALFGIDGMGAPATSRLATAVMDDSSTPAMLAGHGGRDKHTLLLAESPKHAHGTANGITTAGGGGHSHTITTYTQSNNHRHSIPVNPTTAALPIGSPSGGSVLLPGSQSTGFVDTDHNHTGYTDPASTGTHQHGVTITINEAGADGAHQQVPPFFTGMAYIKL